MENEALIGVRVKMHDKQEKAFKMNTTNMTSVTTPLDPTWE